jgi:hypothetical protein
VSMKNHVAAYFLTITVALTSIHRTAWADDDKTQCIESHKRGQLFEREGKWTQAKEQFLVCARAACPEMIRIECDPWYAELARKTPSLILAVRDDKGAEISDVTVRIDDRSETIPFTGTAIALDPGEHVLRIEVTGESRARLETFQQTQRIALREGEVSRLIQFVLPTKVEKTVAPAPIPSPPITVPVWIALGVAGAGAIGFGAFGLWGRSIESDLAANCRRPCSDDEIAPAWRKYVIADVALGVSIVSAAIATVLILTRSPSPASNKATTGSFRWSETLR